MLPSEAGASQDSVFPHGLSSSLYCLKSIDRVRSEHNLSWEVQLTSKMKIFYVPKELTHCIESTGRNLRKKCESRASESYSTRSRT